MGLSIAGIILRRIIRDARAYVPLTRQRGFLKGLWGIFAVMRLLGVPLDIVRTASIKFGHRPLSFLEKEAAVLVPVSRSQRRAT